jgi:hypothetical protein
MVDTLKTRTYYPKTAKKKDGTGSAFDEAVFPL